MKYALAVALLILLVFQVTGLARPEIEMPNASRFDVLFARERLARRMGCVYAWTIYEIPVRDLDRPRENLLPYDLPGLPPFFDD